MLHKMSCMWDVRQTWNLSKILHRRIFRLKILHRQFHLISTVLVRKNTKNEWKWRNLHRWQQILHSRRDWRDGQISPLVPAVGKKNKNGPVKFGMRGHKRWQLLNISRFSWDNLVQFIYFQDSFISLLQKLCYQLPADCWKGEKAVATRCQNIALSSELAHVIIISTSPSIFSPNPANATKQIVLFQRNI